MIRRLLDRHRFPEFVRGADEEGCLQFEVESTARAENRRGRVGWLDLAVRPTHIGAARDDGTGPAVIGDRQPLPVGHEGILRPAKHRANVECVMVGGIKIGVIADSRGQLHCDFRLPMEDASPQRFVIAERGRVGPEQMLQNLARPAPNRAAKGEKCIQ